MNATTPEPAETGFPTVVIQARYVARSTEMHIVEVHNLWVDKNRVFARLPKTDMLAELDLQNPEQGWLVYPN